MELALPSLSIERSMPFHEIEFSIPTHVGHKLAEIVIAGLYESRVRFLAELTANAYDAAPGKAPYIHLPTRLEPWFEVRDEGPGMSPEFMRTRYCFIFDSTKDEDNQAIGGWGMGRLSALAVADSYTLISSYGDTTTTYLVYRGENRMPRLTQLSSEPRGAKPTGVTVRVDIAEKDFNFIRQEASRILGFFEPTPTVNLAIQPIEYLIRKETWALMKKGQPLLVMGGYPYPIDYDSLPYAKRSEIYQGLSGVVIYAPIGAADVTTNRERLKYTDKTVAFLKAAAEPVQNGMVEEAQTNIDALPTLVQKLRYLRQFYEAHEVFKKVLLQKVKIEPLPDCVFGVLNQGAIELKEPILVSSSHRRHRQRTPGVPKVLTYEEGRSLQIDTVAFVEDVKDMRKRVRNFVPANRHIAVGPKEVFEAIGLEYHLISELPDPPKPMRAPRSYDRKKPIEVKLAQKDGEKWISDHDADINAGGVYVKLPLSPEQRTRINRLLNLRIHRYSWGSIRGFYVKPPGGWVLLEDHIGQLVEEKIPTLREEDYLAWEKLTAEHKTVLNWVRQHVDPRPDWAPMKILGAHHDTAVFEAAEAIGRKIRLRKVKDYNPAIAAFIAKRPLLSSLVRVTPRAEELRAIRQYLFPNLKES